MKNEEICRLIEDGLLFLFLGQNFGKESKEILFNEIEKKFNIHQETCRHNEFFQLENIDRLEWIQGQCGYLIPSYEYNIISKLPWNAVLTSSVIDEISKSFVNEWREVYCVSNSVAIKNAITDKSKLVSSFLFGNIYDDLDISRPPISQLEFLKRKAEAVKMLSLYSREVISPYGIMFIDGYKPNEDWLKIGDLVNIFASYGIGQVQYFGGSLKGEDDDWKILCDQGIINEHEESLVEFLFECQNRGFIDLENLELKNRESKLISIEKKSVGIPLEKYNEFIKTSMVLDDSIYLLPEVKEEEYFFEYKHFLYESGNSPVWIGLKNEFDFYRTKTKEIDRCIEKALKDELGVKPIIIHGQAGSGKTMVMSRLAYTYKMRKIFPVLFIPAYYETPSFTTISNICKWLEGQGAKKILIFWDSNFYNDEINQYCELSQDLISSGRKIVLVGTAHKLGDRVLNKYSIHDFYLNSKLESKEIEDLSYKFKKFTDLNLPSEKILEWNNESIVVALYRMLPATRNNIRRGVVEEATQNMEALKDVLVIREENTNRPFEKIFLEAGIISELDNREIEEKYNFEELLNYVCVPAQFGIYIPFSFVLRCLNYEFSVEIGKIIDRIDFFRIVQNENGDFLVFVRNSLEAQIVINNKICNIKSEVEIIKKYIDGLMKANGEVNERKNIEFIISLLKAVGPNGIISDGKYENYYYEISCKLKKIRENGIKHPRLVLQEASYLREYAKKVDIKAKDKIKYFEEAQKLLVQVNQELDRNDNREHLRGWILSELATNYGSQLQILRDEKERDLQTMKKTYESMLEAVTMARGVLADSFHALDVCAWASLSLLRDKKINEEYKFEIYSNVLGVYERAGIESPGMMDLKEYNKRLLELSDEICDYEISTNVFNHLLEIRSASGIYLRTTKIIRDINFKKFLKNNDIKLCKIALNYLHSFNKNYSDILNNDLNCMYLSFKLLWSIKAKEPLYYREKKALPFNQEDWEEILRSIEKILLITPENINANLKYIRFIALFHLDRKKEWEKALKEIQHIYYPYDKRIITNYIASNERGIARVYTGEIVGPISDKKVMVYIPELKKPIPCFMHNFVSHEHAIGEKYKHIELGFNFLGVQVCKINDEREGL